MRKTFFTVIIILTLLLVPLRAEENFENIIEGYKANGFEKSVQLLKDYIDENPDDSSAALQLYSWCTLKNDFVPLSSFDGNGINEKFLRGMYLYNSGKESEGIRLLSELIGNPEFDSYLAYHFYMLLINSDEKLNSTALAKIKNLTPESASDYLLKSLYAIYTEENDAEAAKYLYEGLKKFQSANILRFVLLLKYEVFKPHLVKMNADFSVKEFQKEELNLLERTVLDGMEALIISSEARYADAAALYSDTFKRFNNYGFSTFYPEIYIGSIENLIYARDYAGVYKKLKAADSIGVIANHWFYRCHHQRLYGKFFMKIGKFAESLKYLDKAEELARLESLKLMVYNEKGYNYIHSRKYQEAFKAATSGLRLSMKLDNKPYTASFHVMISNILNEIGKSAEALKHLDAGIKIIKETGNKNFLTTAHAQKANVLMNMGLYASSKKELLKALELSENLQDLSMKGKLVASLGNLYLKMRQHSKAEEYYRKAADIFKGINDTYNLAITEGNLGNLYMGLMEYEKSLQSFTTAVELAEKTKDIRSQANYLTGIGSVYSKVGSEHIALKYYKEAEEKYRTMGSPRFMGEYFSNLANVYYIAGDTEKAHEYDNKASEIFTGLKDPWSLFNVYSNQYVSAWAEKNINDMQRAMTLMEGLAGSMKDPYVFAEVNLMKGVLLTRKGKPVEARGYLQKAAEVFQNYAFRYAWVNFELGISYKKTGDYDKAIKYLSNAVELVERERQNLRFKEKNTGFIARNIDYYYELIETYFLKYARGRQYSDKEKLFSAIEMLKERSFAEAVAESRASLDTHIDPELRAKEVNILGRIAKLNTAAYYAESDEALKKTLATLAEAEQELAELKTKIRLANPVYANVKYPEPVTLKKIIDELPDSNSAILQYLIHGKHIYIFYITKEDTLVWRQNRAEQVERKVRRLLKLVENPSYASLPELRELSGSLYQILVKPISSRVNVKENLVVIPDEVLHYLPFDILMDENSKYMLEKHNIHYSPSATSLILFSGHEESKNTLNLLAMANPTGFPEAAGGKEGNAIERSFSYSLPSTPLKFAEEEVRTISGLFDKKSVEVFYKSDATEKKLKTKDLKDFKFLHFATHGIFNEENPYRSGILLSRGDDPNNDGLLQYHEIYDLKTDADTVVLSACKTGLGRVVKGDGLIGISRGFMIAGARSVLVSLWNVSDKSTSILMKNFYENRVRKGMRSAAALRAAKLELMNMKFTDDSERGISGISGSRKGGSKRPFAHPYFWAAFILTGE